MTSAAKETGSAQSHCLFVQISILFLQPKTFDHAPALYKARSLNEI